MKLILFISMVLFTASCSNTWIAPPFTDSEKIIGLKSSMTIDKVSDQLGIPPFDVYHIKDDGSTVVVYNYRLKNRKVAIVSENKMHNEESQTAGKLWYSKESSLLYVLFKDGKMQSAVTDIGRKDSEALLITNNTIQFLSKDELGVFELSKLRYFMDNITGQTTTKSNQFVIPFNKNK